MNLCEASITAHSQCAFTCWVCNAHSHRVVAVCHCIVGAMRAFALRVGFILNTSACFVPNMSICSIANFSLGRAIKKSKFSMAVAICSLRNFLVKCMFVFCNRRIFRCHVFVRASICAKFYFLALNNLADVVNPCEVSIAQGWDCQ